MSEKNLQEFQEAEYSFPYHYIPRRDRNGFSQVQFYPPGFVYQSYLSLVAEKVMGALPGNLLDIGCGDGRFIHELSRTAPDVECIGVDISERAISFARAFTPKATFSTDNIMDDDAVDRHFNVVSMIDVIEHIEPEMLSGFIAAAGRRVAEDGLMIITVPTTNVPVHEKHYQHFTVDMLKDLLSPGFEVVEHAYINSRSIIPRIMKKVLANGVWAITSSRVMELWYRLYIRFFFNSTPRRASRLLVVARPVQ